MKRTQRGFTLVEMLVVIGLIGLLVALMTGALGYVQTTAWQAQSQELVSNVATALTIYLQDESSWPQKILDSDGVVDNEVCKILQQAGRLDVTTVRPDGTINQNSPERFGLLSPWGKRLVKRSTAQATLGSLPPADLKRHMLRFCVDANLDGKIDSSEVPSDGIPGQDKEKSGVIRASAIVWSCGPQGKAEGMPGAKKKGENRQSWIGGGE